MDTAELAFACQIRHIASDLRSAARSKYYGIIFEDIDERGRSVKLAQWDKENTIEKFVTIALLEVEHLARFIRELRWNSPDR